MRGAEGLAVDGERAIALAPCASAGWERVSPHLRLRIEAAGGAWCLSPLPDELMAARLYMLDHSRAMTSLSPFCRRIVMQLKCAFGRQATLLTKNVPKAVLADRHSGNHFIVARRPSVLARFDRENRSGQGVHRMRGTSSFFPWSGLDTGRSDRSEELPVVAPVGT